MCKKRTYDVLSGGFFATFGLILIVLCIRFTEFASHQLGYLNQISEDWQKVPFVDLTETSDTRCPLGTEEVLFKPWYGTKQMCLRWLTYWTYWEGECPRHDEHYQDCLNLPGMSPVIQA